MRILKLVIIVLACLASGEVLAQQPWSSTSSSDESLIAWNGGGHGGGHNGYRHGYGHGYGHRHFYGHRGYYGPRVIYAPRYYGYGGYYVPPQPYYYPRYGSPRVVIQYYDPRLGIFVGSDFGGY